VKEVIKCFHGFLWKNTDRIKRNTLIADYSKGGLKMIDVEIMIESIKAAWIPRILRTSPDQNVLNEYLSKTGISLHTVLKGNIVDEKLFPDNIFIPQFYKECINSFNKCKHTCQLKNVHEFLTQPIWFNNLFRNKGTSMCYMNWVISGFVWIKDLYDKDGIFLSSDEFFKRVKNKSNWMSEYVTVKRAVEKIGCKFNNKYYALFENVDQKVTIESRTKVYEICYEKSKFFYDLLLDKKYVRSYMEKSWAKHFDREISIPKWEQIYVRRVNKIPGRKLSEFMYKLLHNLILCRKTLFKWKRCNTQVCPICKTEETIEHIYFDCKVIKHTWRKISDCLKVNLTWEKVIIGYTEDLIIHRLRNLIIIILYARYKFWLKGLEEEIPMTMFTNIVVKDFSVWNTIILESRFDRNHNVLLSLWKRYNLVEILNTD